MSINVIARRLRRLLAALIPAAGHGRCFDCRRPWWLVEPHIVRYTRGRGLLVICERCWPRLSPSVRGSYALAHIAKVWPAERQAADWYRVWRAHVEAR